MRVCACALCGWGRGTGEGEGAVRLASLEYNQSGGDSMPTTGHFACTPTCAPTARGFSLPVVPARCGAHSSPVRPGVDVARAGVWLTVSPCVRAQDVFAAALGTIVAPLPITHPVATLGDIVNHRNANGLAPLHVAYGGRFGAYALFVCCCLCAYTPAWVRRALLFVRLHACLGAPCAVRRAPCAGFPCRNAPLRLRALH